MEDFYRKQLEEFVSPSDIPLFEVVSSNIDSICTIKDIFSDRNSQENTYSFILGVIKSVIVSLTGREIDIEKIHNLLINDLGEELDDKE